MYGFYGNETIFKGTASSAVTHIRMVSPLTGRSAFARKVVVRNLGSTNALNVYLPRAKSVAAEGGGDDFVVVAASGSREFFGPIERLSLVAAASTTDYEVEALVAG